MNLTKEELKRFCNATEIRGSFFEMLRITSVFRITKMDDLRQYKLSRNIYFRHMLLQYILIGLLFTVLAATGILLSCIVGKNPLLCVQHLFLAVVGFLGLISAIRYLLGFLYLRRQRATGQK